MFFKRRSNSKVQTPTNPYAADAANNNLQQGLRKNDEFVRFGGIKGLIVDEQGLDVFYWKNLEKNVTFNKQQQEVLLRRINENGGRKSKFDLPVQEEIPVLRGNSTTSHVWTLEESETLSDSLPVVIDPLNKPVSNQEMMKSQLWMLSPPALPRSNAAAVPAPAPPQPPKTGGLTLSSRQPPKDYKSSSDETRVKLKPLHWDKVNANVGHSMVWHKLHNGSFRVDDDLLESLFGTMTIDKKTPPRPGASSSPSPKGRVFLLDTRRSQNISIVVKSLAKSRGNIIDCLLEGTGLNIDTLEKLTRITPSIEEVQVILKFKGDVTRLSDAESFLCHILRAVPSAFTRVNIMLFKSNYRSQVSGLKKSLQTLEMACKELKTRGLFVKLLEAVLKAGNRMNVGTSRGNAQAFSLNSLLKLSDVKSSDGKTTLLHFVVEEVVRSEGKRCNIKTNQSFAFTENYYIKLGLPVVGGVSSEFCNVKKAAGIEYDAFSKSCSGLVSRLAEITKTMEECERDGGGFVREMKMFLQGAEREIQALREEEGRITGLVKITNEYYQAAGASKDVEGGKQFQLFVITRDFLEMVDKACIDIAIKNQKRRNNSGLTEAGMQTSRSPVKFPVLPASFSNSSISSSDSDESP